MTRSALAPSLVRSLYDRKSKRYDLQHALATLRSDERGRRMVVEPGVRPGDRVLDAGGGTGSTALLAAARAGASGHVVVLDFSAGMLGEAEQRARAAGLAERMEFVTGDILELPFDDGSFDAVLSTYSVCPVYDPAPACSSCTACSRRAAAWRWPTRPSPGTHCCASSQARWRV